MAVVYYPPPYTGLGPPWPGKVWKQCMPTTREEVTNIVTDMSQNGVIRGRVFYKNPVYRLTVSHLFNDGTDFESTWEGWVAESAAIRLRWAVDNGVYEGLPANPPVMEYRGPFQIFVSFTLLCKKV